MCLHSCVSLPPGEISYPHTGTLSTNVDYSHVAPTHWPSPSRAEKRAALYNSIHPSYMGIPAAFLASSWQARQALASKATSSCLRRRREGSLLSCKLPRAHQLLSCMPRRQNAWRAAAADGSLDGDARLLYYAALITVLNHTAIFHNTSKVRRTCRILATDIQDLPSPESVSHSVTGLRVPSAASPALCAMPSHFHAVALRIANMLPLKPSTVMLYADSAIRLHHHRRIHTCRRHLYRCGAFSRVLYHAPPRHITMPWRVTAACCRAVVSLHFSPSLSTAGHLPFTLRDLIDSAICATAIFCLTQAWTGATNLW